MFPFSRPVVESSTGGLGLDEQGRDRRFIVTGRSGSIRRVVIRNGVCVIDGFFDFASSFVLFRRASENASIQRRGLCFFYHDPDPYNLTTESVAV